MGLEQELMVALTEEAIVWMWMAMLCLLLQAWCQAMDVWWAVGGGIEMPQGKKEWSVVMSGDGMKRVVGAPC